MTPMDSLYDRAANKTPISIASIKDVRRETGAGMLLCKRALQENNGDIIKAIEWIREKWRGNIT